MEELIQNFIQILQSMQKSDFLDILLVAFLIYKLLPLIRTTHVMRLARTVFLVVMMAWITGMLKLHTLNWILKEILAVGLLAFVVLFQPELRNMINHLGSMNLRGMFSFSRPVQEMDAVIAQTVMACEHMSKERVGALIVFEQEHKLDEYFKAGTIIDGQTTDQLLRNIFFPKAALHDGALVIRNGRIIAAGCVLPLSTNPHLPADVGTRHRAAVGVTEVADAVAVVVSEETGTLSVAEGGMLKRHLAPQDLERLLRARLIPEAEQEGKAGMLGDLLNKADRKENDHEKK